MPLESLLELVKTLSSRIDQHGPALRQSEALTRYALIDPLLRELGWDTSDPGMVIPEYRVSEQSNSADYALQTTAARDDGRGIKKLRTNLYKVARFVSIRAFYCLRACRNQALRTNRRQTLGDIRASNTTFH